MLEHDLREASVVLELKTMTLETLRKLREIERQHQEIREGFKVLMYSGVPVNAKSPLRASPSGIAPQAGRPKPRADRSPASRDWHGQ